jgi:hypothetical protein
MAATLGRAATTAHVTGGQEQGTLARTRGLEDAAQLSEMIPHLREQLRAV